MIPADDNFEIPKVNAAEPDQHSATRRWVLTVAFVLLSTLGIIYNRSGFLVCLLPILYFAFPRKPNPVDPVPVDPAPVDPPVEIPPDTVLHYQSQQDASRQQMKMGPVEQGIQIFVAAAVLIGLLLLALLMLMMFVLARYGPRC